MDTTRQKLATTTCVRPKECDILYYKTDISYAAANENGQNQFELSEKYIKNVRQQMSESTDTQERLLPDKRRINIKEIKKMQRELPKRTKMQDLLGYKKMLIQNIMKSVCYEYVNELGFQKMQDILHISFVVVWDKMNLHDCTSDSLEFSKTLRDSVGLIDNDYLRTAIRLRLGEKLTASKRVLDNLDRVHDAYCNAVPLTNYTVTPNGSYDSFYLTTELFKQSKEMNEMYTRLRGHINKYIENIEGLFHIYTADGHEIQTKNKVLNYTNGLWLASVEYDRDLTAYELFVIRQPLQRIIKARKRFEDYKTREVAIRTNFQINADYVDFFEKSNIVKVFNKAGITITKYKNDLESGKNTSKLHLAREIMSINIMRIAEEYQESISSVIQTIDKLWIAAISVNKNNCECITAANFEPILRAVFVKAHDHYKVATASEKAAMREYFKFEDDIYRGILVGGKITRFLCPLPPLAPFKTSSSDANLMSFIKRMESFLEMTRLDGLFFRYFTLILTFLRLHLCTHSCYMH